MAEVFLAEASRPTHGVSPVVVKRLLPGADETHHHLFHRERQVLGSVDSPNVVRLLGSGPDSLVLEYVDGPDLATLLAHMARRGRRMPLAVAMEILDGVLMGLAALHDARDASGRRLGVVHRDLNPSNVLLSRDGDVKIADLGVVHIDLAEHSTTAGLKGTLAYMAPEQLLGRAVDPRTDLYSAALVAYEVLTSIPARPARMCGIAELLEARSRLPAPPTEVRPDLPLALDAVLLQALSPAPDCRPVDARAWLAELRAALDVRGDRAGLAEQARLVAGETVRAAGTLVPGETATRSSDRAALPRDHRAERRSSPRGRTRKIAAALAIAFAAGLASLYAGATVERSTTREVAVPDAPGKDRPEGTGRSASRAAESGTAGSTGIAVPIPVPRASLAMVRPAAAEPRTPEPLRPPPDPPKSHDQLRIEVRPIGDPVHVEGSGIRGLAPRQTPDLPQGSTLLRLHGATEGLPPALVRLVRSGDGLSATIGTVPDRHFDLIRCGGLDVGETSAVGIRLDGETRCTVTAGSGAMAFSLSVVRP